MQFRSVLNLWCQGEWCRSWCLKKNEGHSLKIRPSSLVPKSVKTHGWQLNFITARRKRLLLTQDKTFGGSSDFPPKVSLKKKKNRKISFKVTSMTHPQILFLGRYRSSGGLVPAVMDRLNSVSGTAKHYLQKALCTNIWPSSIWVTCSTFSYQFPQTDLHTGHSERVSSRLSSTLQRLSNFLALVSYPRKLSFPTTFKQLGFFF